MFKCHTAILTDTKMKECINYLIRNMYYDLYTGQLRYHHKYSKQSVGKYQKLNNSDITLRETKAEFIDYGKSVMF